MPTADPRPDRGARPAPYDVVARAALERLEEYEAACAIGTCDVATILPHARSALDARATPAARDDDGQRAKQDMIRALFRDTALPPWLTEQEQQGYCVMLLGIGWDAGAEWAAARGGADTPAVLWGPPQPDPTHPGRLIRHGVSDGANAAPWSGEGDADGR